MQVFVNGKWKTELQTTTDATGSYGFDLTKAAITNAAAVAEINAAKALSASNIRVVIEAGGYDQNTGQQVGQLIAGATVQTLIGNQPATVAAVTPLTMLLASSNTISEDQLKAQLGITGVSDLSTFNPVTAMSSSNAGMVQLGQSVFTIQQTMYTLIQNAAAVHAGGGAVGADALTSALGSVVDAITANIGSGASNITVNEITAAVIAEELGLDVTDVKVTTIASAIIATNDAVSSYYSHLADAYQTLAQDPSDATAQSWVASAKAAAGVSQTDLIQAVDDYLTGAQATIDVDTITNDIAIQADSMQQLLALKGATVSAATSLFVPVYLVSQVIDETHGGLNDGLAKGILAKDASGAVIANGNSIKLTDIASEISQVSLAELIKLNVESVTVLGANTKIELSLLGNGVDQLTSLDLGALDDGNTLFDAVKVSVTLKVASQAQFKQVLDNILTLENDGIYGFKAVTGSLTIDADTALDWIAHGVHFSSGSFVATTSSALDYDQAKALAAGGVSLATGTVIDASSASLSVQDALSIINSGATFTANSNLAPTLSVALQTSDLQGGSSTVEVNLLKLANAGVGYTFPTTGMQIGNGVAFANGKLTLSNLSMSLSDVQHLQNAAVAGGLNFTNSTVAITKADLDTLLDGGTWGKQLVAIGLKSFVMDSGSLITAAEANALINLNSSVNIVGAQLTDTGMSATQAGYFASHGLIPPSDVSFDLGYAETVVFTDGGSFKTPITVTYAFDPTLPILSANDLLTMVNKGVNFTKYLADGVSPASRYTLSETDTVFTSGNAAANNLLTLVKAGLTLSVDSAFAGLSNTSLSLANAQLLLTKDGPTIFASDSSNTVLLTAADLTGSQFTNVTLPGLLAIGAQHVDIVKPISSLINQTQVDAIVAALSPQTTFSSNTVLQLSTTAAVDAALADNLNFGAKGITTANIGASGLSFTEVQGLVTKGITSVNAGLTLKISATDHVETAPVSTLRAISAMGITTISAADSAIPYAEVRALLNANPSISFAPNTTVDLAGETVSVAMIANLSSVGLKLNLPAGTTITAPSLSLSDAYSMALKGLAFSSGVEGPIQINAALSDGLAGTVSLSQAQKVLSAVASASGSALFVNGTLKVTGADLQTIASAGSASSLVNAGLTTLQVNGNLTVAQASVVIGNGLSFSAGTTIVDKVVDVNTANGLNAFALISKGAIFSGTMASVSSTAVLNNLLNVSSSGSVNLDVLKAAGITSLSLSGAAANVSQSLAKAIYANGGITLVGGQIDAADGSTASDSVVYAKLGLTIPAGMPLTVTGNTISYTDIMALANKGVKVAVDHSPGVGSQIAVSLGSSDKLTIAQVQKILASANTTDAFHFSGPGGGDATLSLSAGNSDLASLFAPGVNLTSVANAGFALLKSATGSLSLTLRQEVALNNAGIHFAAGDTVQIQLQTGASTGNTLADVVTAAQNNALASGIFIKAPGATLNVSASQVDALMNAHVAFVNTDLVTLKLDAGNSNASVLDSLSQLQTYALSGVDQIAASAGSLSVSFAEAQNVSKALMKFVNSDTVTVQLTSAGIYDLGLRDSVIQSAATMLSNIGVTQLQASSGSLTLTAAQIADFTGIGVNGMAATGLKFLSTDASGENVSITARVGGSASDIAYVIDNSVSLHSAGITKLASSTGTLALTTSQVSTLVQNAGNSLTIADGTSVTLQINNNADLSYLVAHAADLTSLNVSNVYVASTVTAFSLTQAESLVNASHLQFTNGIVNISKADLALLNQVDAAGEAARIAASSLVGHGFVQFLLGGSVFNADQAATLLSVLNPGGSSDISISGGVVSDSSLASDLSAAGFKTADGLLLLAHRSIALPPVALMKSPSL